MIGLVRMDKIGAKTTQEIRRQLRNKVDMRVSKRRVQLLALQQSSKKNLDKLAEMIDGSTALLFTDMDPLELAAIFQKNRVKSVARAG
ncbi:MAG: ribosomal protein L10, partial [Promethearchaeota archaeon CR_4]